MRSQKFSGVTTRDLMAKIRSGEMRPAELTFAAEELGNRGDCQDDAIKILVGLLAHKSSVVREGAVYGLADHQDRDEVAEALGKLSSNDPSAGVRQAAADVLI